jgi:poly(3-hydroxybutyrate) depolymerase
MVRGRSMLRSGTAAVLGLGLLLACSSTSRDAESESAIAVDAPEPLDVTLGACPAPYDARPPVRGENRGYNVAGQSRSFVLVPPEPGFTGPRPVLFAFHGTSETGARFVARAKLLEFAARGFIVVAPDAVGNGSYWPVWDAMRSAAEESRPNADLALVDSLLACTMAHFSVDRKRIYAAGHSAGGIFTNRVLRSRSNVFAGGIPASGLFDLTGSRPTPLEPTLAIVTWGGDNDTYRGTTPGGVTTPFFSFVEQASLASEYYASQPNVAHVRCRGNDLGHAWLPLNGWFADVLLSRPKGVTGPLKLPPVPASAPVRCTTQPYELAPLADVVCSSTPRAGCKEACQLFADCALENRTVGPTLSNELRPIGFTSTSCGTCPAKCQTDATTEQDRTALACFERRQAVAQCKPGIEGAAPLYDTVNECCRGVPDSAFCKNLCRSLLTNEAASAFFPTCRTFGFADY